MMSLVPVETIQRPAGRMDAYLAVPEAAPAPGVLVIHDALGRTTDLRHQADWLAEAGFVALAPDLFYWGARVRCLLATMRAFVGGTGRVFEDLAAARDHLAGRPECSGRIGVLGFCLGGSFARAPAPTGAYAAAAVNYGFVTDPETALAGSCPVVGSFGGRDRSLAGMPGELGAALTDLGVEHEITVYPDAGHSFLNDHTPGEMPVWARIAGRYARAAYHEPSAVQARRRITEFLHAHL